VLTVGVEGIKDFQVCELYYQLRHRDKELEVLSSRDLMIRRFEATLRRVASFFFWKRQDGIIPSYSALLRRWERLWFPGDMDAYDIAVEQHEVARGNMASFTTTAAVAIMRFHEVFAADGLGDPIAIDQPFILPVGKELRIEGRYDLVLRQGNEHRVVMFTSAPRRPPLSWFTMDFAAQRLSYENKRDREWRDINVSYSLYDLAGCNSKELLYWARLLQDKNDVFVPRRGFTTYCKTCPFDSTCRDWRKWPR